MKGYVDGRWGQVHFRRHGDGVPIALLHQAPTSSVQYADAFAPLVARGLQPIAFDTPGFGGSDGPETPPAIEDYAAVLLDAIDALQLGPVHLAGHHTGAQLATEIAIQRPAAISSLTLHSPAFLSDKEVAAFRGQMMPFEQHQAAKADGSHLAAAWNWRAAFCPEFRPEIMHRHVVQQLVDIERGWFAHNAWLNYPQSAKVGAVTVRTQVLSNKGDALYPFATRIADIRPDIPFVSLEGGSIDYVDEHPDRWADAVAAFALVDPG